MLVIMVSDFVIRLFTPKHTQHTKGVKTGTCMVTFKRHHFVPLGKGIHSAMNLAALGLGGGIQGAPALESACHLLMILGGEEPGVRARQFVELGVDKLVKIRAVSLIPGSILPMSDVTSRAMLSNALTSRTELDGDVAVPVSLATLAAGGVA